jgi:GxxExxY protein
MLGPGLLESAYEACLAYEIQQRGLRVVQQQAVPLVYGMVKLECGFRADLVVAGAVVVEVKAKEQLHPVDEAQVAVALTSAAAASWSADQFSCRDAQGWHPAPGQ